MAEKKHDFTKKEILAGALVLTSVCVLVGFVAMIRHLRPEENMNSYRATFTNTNGLNNGADVRYGGLLAGKVVHIAPDPALKNQIVVEFIVRPEIPVNEESIATIEAVSLMSEYHLEVSTGDENAALLASGKTLRSVTQSGDFVDIPDMTTLMAESEDLLKDLRELLGVEDAVKAEEESGEEQFTRVTAMTKDLEKLLDSSDGMLTDLRDLLEEKKPDLDDIIAKLKDMQDGANDLLGNANSLLEDNSQTFGDTLKGAEELVSRLNQVVADIQEPMQKLTDSLQSTLDNADKLTGEAYDLIKSNRPALEALLIDLQDTLKNLKTFTRVLSEQPQSIVRGKSPQGR